VVASHARAGVCSSRQCISGNPVTSPVVMAGNAITCSP
jgi:hypothetical protein